MADPLLLGDHATRDDLRIYLERVLRAGREEVRLVTRDAVLAVFGCTQAPEGLTDPTPVVLVLRAFSLAEAPPAPQDVVVPVRALLDRIARLGVFGLALDLPDAQVTVAWAGVLPPRRGWRPVGTVDARSLSAVAAEGVARVAAALPDAPGEAVVRRVRGEVWGADIAPGLPAAAAFAADAMGFLDPAVASAEGSSPTAGTGAVAPVGEARSPGARLSETARWKRLTTDRGEVLVRSFLG